MYAAHDLPDTVILGRSSRTRGPGVAHPDRDSPPPGGAVPIHDTPSTPQPTRTSPTRSAVGPSHSSFAATHLEQHRRPPAHRNPTTTTVVSLLVAIGLAATAVLIVDWAGSTFGGANVVGFTSTAAAGLCGLLLVVASLIGSKGGR